MISAVVITVALIGVGIYTVVLNTQKQDKSLVIQAIGDITTSPEKFVGQKVTVQGYYYQGDLANDHGYLTDIPVKNPIVQESLNNVNFLIINFSSFNITFSEAVLYYFTGTFESSQNTLTHVTSYSLLLKAIEQP